MSYYRIIAIFERLHPRLNGTITAVWKRKHHRQVPAFRHGVWRVLNCHRETYMPRVFSNQCRVHGPELWTVSERPYRKGTIINPAAALKRALAARRNNGKATA